MKNFDVVDGIKMMNVFCTKCHHVFVIPARRGKPPLFCTSCVRNGAYEQLLAAKEEAKKQKSRDKVAALEERLKARGSHISQHREES